MILGGIEAGGTKFLCLVGDEHGTILARERFATRGPAETMGDVLGFFRAAAADGHAPEAVGIGSFGPLELRPVAGYGRVMATPKAGWQGADLVGPLVAELGVPVALDTDVNAAALGEARWGAAQGLGTFVYMTVGTGIGAGALVDGRPIHGLVHPEMGHVSVPREPGDDFAGACTFHGDCLEGMASGSAMAARWGRPAEELAGAALARAVDLEARYLAAGVRNMVYALAPERIVIGGGVVNLPGLLPALRARLSELLGGYPGLDEHGTDAFVSVAGLGQMAGPRGTLVLAESAARRTRSSV
jgi:fructokinase